MKKTDFNKEIKILSLAKDKLLGLELKSILYTPNKYRIPVAFADRSNSADDTEKYIRYKGGKNYRITQFALKIFLI